jgi:hypothetical protein
MVSCVVANPQLHAGYYITNPIPNNPDQAVTGMDYLACRCPPRSMEDVCLFNEFSWFQSAV